jgi:hypothetical protein
MAPAKTGFLIEPPQWTGHLTLKACAGCPSLAKTARMLRLTLRALLKLLKWGYNPAWEENPMSTTPRPESQQSYFNPLDFKWSGAEKAIARKAFELALQQEMKEVIREAKHRAAKIVQPAELWELESYLTHRRKQIDRQYDYRYSVLPLVLANLLREGRLTEKDLHGLNEDKLSCIRQGAKL